MILPSVSMLLSTTRIVGIGPHHAIALEAWQSLIPLLFPRQCPTYSTILPSRFSHASLGGGFLISPHRPTVSHDVTSAVVGTYGCGGGRIALTHCALIDAGLDGR